MMRRRRRRRATWGYANGDLLSLNAATPTDWSWILPPGRVNYLCDTDRVDSILFMGCHLWLDWDWVNAGSTTEALFDARFYVVASQLNTTGDAPIELSLNPFSEPSTPASITSWQEFDTDGTDSFLWSHFIKGQSPPNYLVLTQSWNNSPTKGGNQREQIYPKDDSFDTLSSMCRNFDVRAAWQPDVRIKSKRRLRKDTGIALVVQAETTPTGNSGAHLGVRTRVLLSRGK